MIVHRSFAKGKKHNIAVTDYHFVNLELTQLSDKGPVRYLSPENSGELCEI